MMASIFCKVANFKDPTSLRTYALGSFSGSLQSFFRKAAQLAFTFSKLTIESLEQSVKYIQN